MTILLSGLEACAEYVNSTRKSSRNKRRNVILKDDYTDFSDDNLESDDDSMNPVKRRKKS